MTRKGCPNCGDMKLYSLRDGRRMCAGCRAKFSVRPRRSRLSHGVRQKLLGAFWQGSSARRAAYEAGVNEKTAQAYFRRARALLAEDAPAPTSGVTTEALGGNATSSQRVAVFGIQEGLRTVRVLMPGEAARIGGLRNASISWVYASSPEAARRLELSSFFRIGRRDVVLWHGKAQINRVDSFWAFARSRLKTFHGGYRSSFALFLKEMAFRFNARSTPDAYASVRALLEA